MNSRRGPVEPPAPRNCNTLNHRDNMLIILFYDPMSKTLYPQDWKIYGLSTEGKAL
jgi:hypothetical protein